MLVQLRRHAFRWVPGAWPATSSELRTGITWLLIPAGFLLAVFALLRMTYPASAEKDDCDLLLFSQRLAWGYSDMSPVYTWLAHFSIQAFGVGVAALTIVRVAVLLAIYVLLYANARELELEPRLAALAAHGVLLVPALAWNSLTYLTHTNALIAASLWVLFTFLRLVRTGRTRDYVLFGAACGIAVLSKYNAAWFIAALAAAGLTIAPARRRLLDRRLVLAMAIGGLLVVPHGIWLLDQWQTIAVGLREKATRPETADQGYIHRVLLGIKETLLLAVVLAVPAIAAVAICFRGALRTAAAAPEAAIARRLVARLMGFAVLVVLIQVAAVGATKVHERWVIHFAAVIPLWLFCRLSSSRFQVPGSEVHSESEATGTGGFQLGTWNLEPGTRSVPAAIRPPSVRAFAALLIVLAAGYTTARVVQLASPPGVGSGWHPIKTSEDELARAIAAEVGDSATIVTSEQSAAGNLRLRLPNARIIYSGYRNFPGPEPAGPMVILWNRADGLQPPWPYFHLVSHLVKFEPIPLDAVREVPVTPGSAAHPPVVMAFAVVRSSSK